MTQTRGRPRQFDEDTALQAALQVFWTKGFSATSLDDLAEAMTMNRPSIYRAFGGKEIIYRRALEQFANGMEQAFDETMLSEDDIRGALTNFYLAAIGVYTSGSRARGCMFMSTAVTAATTHPEIQSALLSLIQGLDKKFAKRMKVAQADGQLSADIDAAALAQIAQSLLHSLSLRARAGDSEATLKRMVTTGVAILTS